MKFKTNVKDPQSLDILKDGINREFPDAELKYELENTDGVLHVHGIPENAENAAKVESAIRESGFNGAWLTRGLENR